MRNKVPVDLTSEIAIFGRLLRGGRPHLSPVLARHVLTLGFDEADRRRMSDLAARNQEGGLSASEKVELMNYVKAGHLLALLHSKARQSLKKKQVS